MRLMITGGCGFIGSNLVRYLVGLGHEVLNVDKLTYAGNRESLADLETSNLYQLCVADICDRPTIQTIVNDFSPDAILHLAAESHVDRSIDNPDQFINTNVLGTYTLLSIAHQYWQQLSPESQKSFRFLHVSTDEVYGSLGPEGLFSETSPYNPHSPYSASKASSDHLARVWHTTYGLPVLISNCSNNYGPYQFPEKLIPVVILKAIRGEPIPVYGAGENIRDWLYVTDHCSALWTIVQQGRAGETYNIGGNNELRNIDLVRLLCGLLDELRPREDGRSYTEQITFVTDRPGHDFRYAIDASKINRQLGWSPVQDRQSGFRKTVQWYLENETWWQGILDGSYQLERLGTSTERLLS